MASTYRWKVTTDILDPFGPKSCQKKLSETRSLPDMMLLVFYSTVTVMLNFPSCRK